MSTWLSNFDGYSTDLTEANAVERTFLPTKVSGARVRVKTFGYENASAEADGNVVALAVLPKNATILQIVTAYEAHGGTAAYDLGLYQLDGTVIDDDIFDINQSIATAGQTVVYPAADGTVAALQAAVGDDMYDTTAEVVLAATVETGAWGAGKGFAGFVVYALNS